MGGWVVRGVLDRSGSGAVRVPSGPVGVEKSPNDLIVWWVNRESRSEGGDVGRSVVQGVHSFDLDCRQP